MSLVTRGKGKEPAALAMALEAWIYGVALADREMQAEGRLFRRAAAHALKGILEGEGPLEASDDAVEATVAYARAMEAAGLMVEDEITLRPDRGKGIMVTIGDCPFRGACTWMKNQGWGPYCSQGVGMTEVIRRTSGRSYGFKLREFSRSCSVELLPDEEGLAQEA